MGKSFLNVIAKTKKYIIEAFAAEMFSQKEKPAIPASREINHYKIIKLSGRGEIGEVLSCRRQKTPPRKIALKL